MIGLLEADQQIVSIAADRLPININEALHVLGYYNVTPDESINRLINECIDEELKVCRPQGLYSVFPIKKTEKEDTLDLGFALVSSKDLSKNLKDCEYVILFAATIGPMVDQLIFKNSRLDPLKGYVLQATGAMLIEGFCDHLNEQLREEARELGFKLRPRFSPGYGDFKLSHQRDVFSHLSNAKKLGISLMESGIMAPSKSVTAVIGMYRPSVNAAPDYLPGCGKCETCNKCNNSEDRLNDKT